MGYGGRDFSVTVKSQELVAPLLPIQEQLLPLSNLDLLLPPVDFSVFFCYRLPDDIYSFSCMVGVLKASLAQVLQSYYVLGGEVVTDSDGESQILCSNKGVDFLQAYADVELNDLELYNPDASVQGKLVSKNNGGVLCLQVTELKCGGIVVASTFDHRIADAYSANMFLVSWVETAQLKPLSTHPSFQRSFLNPHQLNYFNMASLDNMYVPLSILPPPSSPSQSSEIASRIYYITADHISRIQSQANYNGSHSRTKLESFSAYLWQCMSKAAHEETKVIKMGIVVDGRARFLSGVEECKSFRMTNYFGNVLSIPFGEMGVNQLNTNPLPWVAESVHRYMEVATTKNHFLGLIDWVEAHRPKSALSKIYCARNENESSFVVSSGQRFPVSKVDFGWGKPIFGSYHFPWEGNAGYVMPMPSPKENGDWVVYMHLMKEQLEFLEADAGDVFRPLTIKYLSY